MGEYAALRQGAKGSAGRTIKTCTPQKLNTEFPPQNFSVGAEKNNFNNELWSLLIDNARVALNKPLSLSNQYAPSKSTLNRETVLSLAVSDWGAHCCK